MANTTHSLSSVTVVGRRGRIAKRKRAFLLTVLSAIFLVIFMWLSMLTSTHSTVHEPSVINPVVKASITTDRPRTRNSTILITPISRLTGFTNTLRSIPKSKNALIELIAANKQSGVMSDYQEHVVRVLVRAAGVDLAHALFDPQAVTEAEKEVLRNAESTSWLADRLSQWASGLLHNSSKADFPPLGSFNEAADVLWTAKQQLSIGISRLLKDQANAALYTEVYTASTTARTLTAQRAFDAALEKVFSDYAHLLRKSIYLAQALTIRSVLSAAKNAPLPNSMTPATDIMADLASNNWTRDTPSNADVLHTPVDLHLRLLLGLRFSETTRDAFKARARGVLHEYITLSLSRSAQGESGKRELAELLRREVGVLDVRREWMFDDVGYWYFGTALGSPNYMPSATCTTLVRNDENTEGGRYVCNAEYLMYASSDMRGWFTRTGDSYNMFTTPETAFPHRIVGAGSENKYLWEEEQVEMFHIGKHWNASVNTINDITIMDCTVDTWHVTKKLKGMSMNDRFQIRLTQVCLSGADGEATALTGKPIISMPNLKKLVNTQSSGDYAHVVSFSVDSVPVRTPPRQVLTSAFDDISIFKVDIEWDEYRMVDAWATHELLAWAKHAHGTDTPFATYDMQSVLGDTFLSYSMYQSEIHIKHMDQYELYPIVVIANSIDGVAERVQNSFLYELSLRSLGQVAVSSEYNPLGSSFRESVHAHTRYFLRSEVWMALKTFDETRPLEGTLISTGAPDGGAAVAAAAADAFRTLVMDAAERAVGTEWRAAMDDSSFADAAPDTPTAADDLDDLSWKSRGIPDLSLKMLYVAKQSVSTGLWRLQNDPDMISMYARLYTASNGDDDHGARQAFVFAIEKVVRAYAASLRAAMQLVLDDVKTPLDRTLHRGGTDDMELTMQFLAVVRDIHHSTTIDSIKAAMLSMSSQRISVERRGEAAVKATLPLMPMPLTVVYSKLQRFERHFFRAGYVVTRHIGCADMMQLGATGALCNGGYLLSSGTDNYMKLLLRHAAGSGEGHQHVILDVRSFATNGNRSFDDGMADRISVGPGSGNRFKNRVMDASGPHGILSALQEYGHRVTRGGVGVRGVRAFDDIALLHMDDSAMSTAGMRRWAEADTAQCRSGAESSGRIPTISNVAWHQIADGQKERFLAVRVAQYRYLMFNRLGFLSHYGHTVNGEIYVQFNLVHYSYFIKSEMVKR